MKELYGQLRQQGVAGRKHVKEVRMGSEGDVSVITRRPDNPPDGAGRPDAG